MFEVGFWLEVQDQEHIKSVSLGFVGKRRNQFVQIRYRVEVDGKLEGRYRCFQYDDPHLHNVGWHEKQKVGKGGQTEMRKIGEVPVHARDKIVPFDAFRDAMEHNLRPGDVMVLVNKEWTKFYAVHVVKDVPGDLFLVIF